MRISLLGLGLYCLVGFVYSNTLPTGFDKLAVLRSDDENNGNDEIVGGSAAKAGEFPFLSGLILGSSLCGGSLIAPNIILTAAHCLYGKAQSSVKTFKVILNSTSLNGGPGSVTKTVRRFIIHPDYSPSTIDNDIALLALNTPATDVNTITLPPADNIETYAGKKAVIAGYGTKKAGGRISTKLLKAKVTILENTVCNNQYGNINNLKICAAAPGKDTCQGDSGGPMVVNDTLVGVTSYGKGCADEKYAGVYARVSTFVNWINDMIAII